MPGVVGAAGLVRKWKLSFRREILTRGENFQRRRATATPRAGLLLLTRPKRITRNARKGPVLSKIARISIVTHDDQYLRSIRAGIGAVLFRKENCTISRRLHSAMMSSLVDGTNKNLPSSGNIIRPTNGIWDSILTLSAISGSDNSSISKVITDRNTRSDCRRFRYEISANGI